MAHYLYFEIPLHLALQGKTHLIYNTDDSNYNASPLEEKQDKMLTILIQISDESFFSPFIFDCSISSKSTKEDSLNHKKNIVFTQKYTFIQLQFSEKRVKHMA